MNDASIYFIRIHGQVDEDEINAMSPLQMAVEQVDARTTQLTVCTDQSGLVGLMRHLHGLGYTLISVTHEGRANSA